MKVYAYSGCQTCKKALAWLDACGRSYQLINIREQPPSLSELKAMLRIYGGAVGRLFNTSGRDYRKLGISQKLKGMSADQALRLLASNGNLIKRPFVLAGNTGAVGFKIDEWKQKGLR